MAAAHLSAKAVQSILVHAQTLRLNRYSQEVLPQSTDEKPRHTAAVVHDGIVPFALCTVTTDSGVSSASGKLRMDPVVHAPSFRDKPGPIEQQNRPDHRHHRARRQLSGGAAA